MTAPDNYNSFVTEKKRLLETGRVDKAVVKSVSKYLRKLEEGTSEHREIKQLLEECEQALQRPAAPTPTQPRGSGGRYPSHSGSQHHSNAGRAGGRSTSISHTTPDSHTTAGSPSVLDEAFHNPYTFIPFPSESDRAPRGIPTLRTIDEDAIEGDKRHTGVLDLEIRNLSPLLTCDPNPISTAENEHKTYQALTYGDDLILPASGVRGSLRSLMSVLTGGTLDYVDEHLWLVQGRDVQLGGEHGGAFLGELIKEPKDGRNGRVRLGQTVLLDLEKLTEVVKFNIETFRPLQGKNVKYLWASEPYEATVFQRQYFRKRDRGFETRDVQVHVVGDVVTQPDDKHRWKLKLSGRPVGGRPFGPGQWKREGAFLPDGSEIDLPWDLWQDFLDHQRHADIRSFKPGDLIWLEHHESQATTLIRSDEIASVQWSRWGRKGRKLLDLIQEKHRHVVPDAWNADGQVDMVSDLFGQVPMVNGAAPAYAARIRPENLVFENAAKEVDRTPLAPLMQPHPGCVAFYRHNTDPDSVSANNPLRGYKVYRNTIERGQQAPWHYRVQGVYSKSANKPDDPPQQRINKTCDLLREGLSGKLRIAFHALTNDELSLLLLACSVDWHLGGGKPFGLGHCRVTSACLTFEDGSSCEGFSRSEEGYPDPADLPAPYADLVQHHEQRIQLWHASQRPVRRLRYPRASDGNRNNRIQRGGHLWFMRHATPKKSRDGQTAVPGLQRLHVAGELKGQAGDVNEIAGQLLPILDPTDPLADVLFGYDLLATDADKERLRDKRTQYHRLAPFKPDPEATPVPRGGHQPQSRGTRSAEKDRRGKN